MDNFVTSCCIVVCGINTECTVKSFKRRKKIKIIVLHHTWPNIHHQLVHLVLQLNCNHWPRNGVMCVLAIIIRHKCIYFYILWLTFLPVYNGYCGFNKAGLPWAQQCVLYLYPLLLLTWGVNVTCSGSSTWFTLHRIPERRPRLCKCFLTTGFNAVHHLTRK